MLSDFSVLESSSANNDVKGNSEWNIDFFDDFDSLSKANSELSFVNDSLFNESTFVEIPPFDCEFNDESRKKLDDHVE